MKKCDCRKYITLQIAIITLILLLISGLDTDLYKALTGFTIKKEIDIIETITAVSTVAAVIVSLWLSRRGEHFALENLRLQLLTHRLQIHDKIYQLGKVHNGGIPNDGNDGKLRGRIQLINTTAKEIDLIKTQALFDKDIYDNIKNIIELCTKIEMILDGKGNRDNLGNNINLINNTIHKLPNILKPYLDFSTLRKPSA